MGRRRRAEESLAHNRGSCSSEVPTTGTLGNGTETSGPIDHRPCPLDASNDADDDGLCGAVDNCPAVANGEQVDADADGKGDPCNNCPLVSNADQFDGDADGYGKVRDNCPSLANGDQVDFDADGWGDLCETGVLVADADNSARIDGLDLAMLGRAFGSQAGDLRYEPRVDLNRDGIVDGADLALMAAVWGHGTPGT